MITKSAKKILTFFGKNPVWVLLVMALSGLILLGGAIDGAKKIWDTRQLFDKAKQDTDAIAELRAITQKQKDALDLLVRDSNAAYKEIAVVKQVAIEAKDRAQSIADLAREAQKSVGDIRNETARLKKQLSPRLMTQTQQNELTQKLSRFKGQRGTVIASPSTAEGEWFARVLSAPLIAAGWDIKILPGTATATILFPSGVIIGYPYRVGNHPQDAEAANTLANYLNEHDVAATVVPTPDLVDPLTVQITIAAK